MPSWEVIALQSLAKRILNKITFRIIRSWWTEQASLNKRCKTTTIARLYTPGKWILNQRTTCAQTIKGKNYTLRLEFYITFNPNHRFQASFSAQLVMERKSRELEISPKVSLLYQKNINGAKRPQSKSSNWLKAESHSIWSALYFVKI